MPNKSLSAALVMLVLVLAATAQVRVFHGEVSDSQCALNVHSLTRSHQEMLKSKSMGGTANTCAVYCIEHLGGYLVLSSGKDGKDVYRLDRADLVHGFEGHKVKVTGTLDPKLNQIHVQKIELEGD
jgi:putative hemolysin